MKPILHIITGFTAVNVASAAVMNLNQIDSNYISFESEVYGSDCNWGITNNVAPTANAEFDYVSGSTLPAGLVNEFSGSGVLYAQTGDNNGGGVTGDDYVDYSVIFSTPGTYRLYARYATQGMAGQNDSFFIDFGTEAVSPSSGTFIWEGTDRIETVSAGDQLTVRISARENDIFLDRFSWYTTSEMPSDAILDGTTNSVIPEPSSALMVILGCAGFAFRRKR